MRITITCVTNRGLYTNLIFVAGSRLHHLNSNRVDACDTQTQQQQASKNKSSINSSISVSYSLQDQINLSISNSGGTCSVNSNMNTCAECDMGFIDPQSFQAHMANFHEKYMPYVCSLCGKCYGSLRGLQHHISAHDGKVYACPVCDSTFSQSGTMFRHIKIVHNSRQCGICKGIFKLNDFNRHVLHCK